MPATDFAVRREITVNAAPERAFTVFAEQFDTWWPRGHHIGQADLAKAVIDPATMTWYELGVDGSRTEWGAILAYEPPSRLLMQWRIGGTWQLEDDPGVHSEIEVTFAPEGDATRVTLEHRHLDRHTAGDALRDAVGGEGGWNGLLAAYSDAVG
jgi:uncharacterized protein YndB with AHSA1/START domain